MTPADGASLPTDTPYHLTRSFLADREERPGDAWRRVVARGWPGWRRWTRERMRAEGKDSAIRPEEGRRALRRYMPEFVPLLDRLVEAAQGEDELAAFLSFWTPPRYLVHCSQMAGLDAAGPFLIRNYDLDPALNEATLLATAWRGRRVVGMVEGLAGLADGMNDHGLVVSLTFGGRVNAGPGFGVPLIVRFVLETCRDVADGVAALRGLPCHMSYNLTLADRHGRAATVFLAPDRPAVILGQRFAVNHQLDVEWPRHGRISRTRERHGHLSALAAAGTLDEPTLVHTFLTDPVHARHYARGFGTVYTAIYRPLTGEARLLWQHGDTLAARVQGDFERQAVEVRYSDSGTTARRQPWERDTTAPECAQSARTWAYLWDHAAASHYAGDRQ